MCTELDQGITERRMDVEDLRVGMIGCGFMGEAHSRGYRNVASTFDVALRPVLKAVCGRREVVARSIAERYGWERVEMDWRDVVTAQDVDLVDIVVPNNLHRDIVLAAAANGKQIFCEKPLANTTREAREMLEAVRSHGVKHMVAFCNRRIPAIEFARQLITEGVLGRIFHWRAVWRADWAMDSATPLTWRFQRRYAGSGALGDIGSHLVDLARFLIGDIVSVTGITSTFVTSREVPGETGRVARVDVDDAALFLARFRNGAVGTFEASRFCAGEKERFSFEINGEKASIRFDYDDVNKIQMWERMAHPTREGFRDITMDSKEHPEFPWEWGGGHGKTSYGDLFTYQARALIAGLASCSNPVPDFEDGLRCQATLDAVLMSVQRGGCWVDVDEVVEMSQGS